MSAERDPHPQAVRTALVVLIADDLERSIKNLGYPVGMGLAPNPATCTRAAEQIVDNITDKALALLAERNATAGDRS